MKNIKFYLWFLIASVALITWACDDDSDESTPIFPTLQQVAGDVGETKALSFEASNDWTLTSSALWCRFEEEGQARYSCSGKAGSASVNIYITNEASAVHKDYKAELTLIMGGEDAVIFEVTRPQTGYELYAYNADKTVKYSAEHPFVQDYSGDSVLLISANADWVLEAMPALDFSMTNSYAEAGQEVEIKPDLATGIEYRKSAWEDVLTFRNKEGEVMAELPVRYDGMPADKIEFSNENAIGHAITFSHDGGSYNLLGQDAPAPMPLSVIARNDQYTAVYVDYIEGMNEMTWEYEYTFTIMDEADSWIFVDDDSKGNMDVYVSPNPADIRNAFLMIFPNAVYETVKADFANQVLSTSEGIVYEYVQYLAGRFSQSANPSLTNGFDVTDGNFEPLYDAGGAVIETISYMDAIGDMSEAELIQKYGTSNVSILSLPLGISYDYIIAKPRGFTGYYIMSSGFDVWQNVEVYGAMLDAEIMGIGPDVTGPTMMGVQFIDPEQGSVYGVLLITRY
ncbi:MULTISPECIES: DUF5003 domain-containing protein [unclassified Carboxylicivirga]|uniref:DUF5003 domain-containing protein n=1 Tax=Carboxylicivirga TaxID=1628153 RepID=UPI003D338BD3